jgi:hypothetical protein
MGKPKYNYQNLASFLENNATPGETARHLDQLLYFLVYYVYREGRLEGFFRIYTEIFDLKVILENMEKTS